jgi:hypothetical protein
METSISVSRASHLSRLARLVHRRRAYDVLIDGEVVGSLTPNDWLGTYAITPGRRLVQIRAGRLTSQVVAVTVQADWHASLSCMPRLPLEAAARRLTDPSRSIILRDDAWSSTAIPHRLPFGWRVTRYDPAKRTEEGWYAGNAWTDRSDIGRTFDDGVLTRETYEATERAYLAAVQSFATAAGVTQLQIRDPSLPANRRRARSVGDLKHGRVVPIAAALDLVRGMLRNEAWCRLESPNDDFTVHVGDELYLYVGATTDCASAVAEVGEGPLFVEAFDPDEGSPYIPNDGGARPA